MVRKQARGKSAKCGAETRTCHCGHNRKQHEPNRGRCTVCGCEAFHGTACTQPGTGVGGRCSRHGGATPTGVASPAWKNGRWSKYLPAGLAARFQEGLEDRSLMQLQQDTALIDAALTIYAQHMKERPGKPLTKAQEERLIRLTEHRRRLIEADARRQRDLQQLVPADKFMSLISAVADVIREFVPKADLPRAQVRLQQLLLGQGRPTIDVTPEGSTHA